jgi:transcription antitermination factor NusG
MANTKPLQKKHSKSEKQKNWYVLYCKPNTEKKTAQRLAECGIKVYCPVKTELRQWSDRKKKVEVPVLPSMIMVNLHEKNRSQVFQVPTSVRYLFWLKKPATVRQEEIEELQSILSGDTSQVTVEQMSKGQAIKLSGLGFEEEKAVIKYVTKSHYCVYLERLGYMVKVKR